MGPLILYFQKRKIVQNNVIATVIEFLVGGIFYGWPSYVFVLKEEKVFYDLCNETEVEVRRLAANNSEDFVEGSL